MKHTTCLLISLLFIRIWYQSYIEGLLCKVRKKNNKGEILCMLLEQTESLFFAFLRTSSVCFVLDLKTQHTTSHYLMWALIESLKWQFSLSLSLSRLLCLLLSVVSLISLFFCILEDICGAVKLYFLGHVFFLSFFFSFMDLEWVIWYKWSWKGKLVV